MTLPWLILTLPIFILTTESEKTESEITGLISGYSVICDRLIFLALAPLMLLGSVSSAGADEEVFEKET